MTNNFCASSSRWRWSVWLPLACVLVASSGCQETAAPAEINDAECISSRTFFIEDVWIPTLSKTCIGCHAPGGIAESSGSRLIVLPPQYPNFLDANLEVLEQLAREQGDDGLSTLLSKPLGQRNHGGGVQLASDDPRYQAMAELVALFQGERAECAADLGALELDDLVQRSALSTYRKATLQLAGRLPTTDEIEQIGARGDDALPELLAALMEEPAFRERLKEIFNDSLLVNKYLELPSSSINRLGKYDFPRVNDWYRNLPREDRTRVGAAVATEPLDLMVYVVARDRPFTEVLTAPYTVVNPYSAGLYETGTVFADPTDVNEFHEATIEVHRDGALMPMPHAGILTRPMFLNRFPTTPTNRNRGRTRMILDTFLATNILEFSDRPVDPLATNQYANPVMEDPGCVVCHRIMDPMAGAFMRFEEFDHQGEYYPEVAWYDDVFAPGYGEEIMAQEAYDDATAWLGARIVADPRFAIAAVHLMFRGLTGQEPVLFPTDAGSPDFESALISWQIQDRIFTRLSSDFVNNDYDLKSLIRDIVLSPYFRTADAIGPLTPERERELDALGAARLVIPEVMGRKIAAITGLGWTRFDGKSYASADYNILLGGIDSDAVVERLTMPNGVMSNVIWRMANYMSCELTAWQFVRPAAERPLLPYVELDTVPEDAAGVADAAAIEAIKRNIQYLHAHILDEALPLDDVEIESTYQLFYETWQAGRDALASGAESPTLHWRCQSFVDPETGEPLPSEVQVRQDPDYTVRAWMAVMTYLLTDYRFIYE